MGLKDQIDNHPIGVILALLATTLGAVVSAKTLFVRSPTTSYTNSGPGTINAPGRDVNVYQTPGDKDANTPQGAREALARQGKTFDDEGFFNSICNGDVEQARLYLIGGKSPNDLHMGYPLLGVAIGNRTPNFKQLLDLFVSWKSDPLNFSRVNPRIDVAARIRGIPETQEGSIFTQLAYRAVGNVAQPSTMAVEAREDAELLLHEGAQPEAVIKAFEKANDDIAADEARALASGVDQEQDARFNSSTSPKQIIAENISVINFLRSIK